MDSQFGLPWSGLEVFEALFDAMNGGVLSRIDSLAERCGTLGDWATTRHRPDEGRLLHRDDVSFAAAFPVLELGHQAASGHAAYPAMSAAGNLCTVGVLAARRRTHRQPHLVEVMQLCRTALESASLTIWLLSASAPEIRRARYLSGEMEQLRQRRRFLVIDAENEATRGERFTAKMREGNAKHFREFNEMFDLARERYVFDSPPTSTDMARSSARWADMYMPDTEGMDPGWRERLARSFYSYGSSFVHGYQWLTEYAGGGEVFAFCVEAMEVALSMTEAAICLYETAARVDGRVRPSGSSVPVHLEATIAAWSSGGVSLQG